jgi:dihydroorotase
MYAQAFESVGALDALEAFASFHGPDFYGLPRNRAMVTLERRAWTVPAELKFGDATVVPLGAGESLAWKLRA